jgi:hypothetical protein
MDRYHYGLSLKRREMFFVFPLFPLFPRSEAHDD